MEPFGDPAAQYADFATEARGGSPCFEEWACGVAGDPEVLAWLATLPAGKQQPNLVFAAARWHGVPAPGPYDALRAALLADDGTIRATILRRSTQTNEVERLATLTPAFAALADGRPLALLEVGASAGLCLYPDRYDYAWRTAGGVVRSAPGRPVLTCEVSGRRAAARRRCGRLARGIDLNPLDVTDEDAMSWLTTLVWPERRRRERLERAIAIARPTPGARAR